MQNIRQQTHIAMSQLTHGSQTRMACSETRGRCYYLSWYEVPAQVHTSNRRPRYRFIYWTSPEIERLAIEMSVREKGGDPGGKGTISMHISSNVLV